MPPHRRRRHAAHRLRVQPGKAALPPPGLTGTAHPGYAATNLQSHAGNRVFRFAMEKLGNRLLAQDAVGGALPTLYAATQDLPGNTCAGPRNGLRGSPAPCPRAKAAQNKATARRLGTVSETLTAAIYPTLQKP
jgi:hypothetical protein